MKVWVDQSLCTGDALCADVCPELFFLHDDGRSYVCYVREVGESGLGADGRPRLEGDRGRAAVPRSLEAAVCDAAADCPGECIFMES